MNIAACKVCRVDNSHLKFNTLFTNQIYPISVYMGEQMHYYPRSYLLFDHIEHGMIITDPMLGGNSVCYQAGTWNIKGDTVVANFDQLLYTPSNIQRICVEDSICYELFGLDSIHPSRVFLIEGEKLVDITYLDVPEYRPDEYKLIHGVPLNRTSNAVRATLEDREQNFDIRYRRR